MTDSHAAAHPRPNYGAIFVTLFVLTVLEVIAANLPIPRVYRIASLIGLAITKASLVAMFYMHLRFERKLLAVMAVSPLLFSLILAHATTFDFRRNKSKLLRPAGAVQVPPAPGSS